MFNKNKKIPFFVVINVDNPETFLSITCTKDEALDFAYKYLRLQNFNHFEMWCTLRNYQVNSDSAWAEYFNKVVSIEDKKKFVIRKIKYDLADIAAILRMFGGCMPIGSIFDTKTEYDYLNRKLQTQKLAQEINSKIETIMKQKEEENQNGEQ